MSRRRQESKSGRKPNNKRRSWERKNQDGSHEVESFGRLSMTGRGFGFIAVESGGPDVFIPAPRINGAIHQDRVKVTFWPSAKGREGRVEKVLQRGIRFMVGQLRKRGRVTELAVDDERLPDRVALKGVPGRLRAGTWVRAELDHSAEADDAYVQAVIVEDLSDRTPLQIEMLKLVMHEGVTEEFPDAVEAHACNLSTRVLRGKEREDLRDISLVTIDPTDAKDHDDAVWAEKTRSGYRVIVMIADVSHYVEEGDALDREAVERGCSIYLPGRVIPMLPHALSSDLASLKPNKNRYCLGVEVRLDTRGEVKRHRYIEGIMRSKARLSYEDAAIALGLLKEAAGGNKRQREQHRPMLETLQRVAQLLHKRRLKRGSLTFDLPEAKVIVDEATGEPVDAIQARHDPGLRQAYNLIEELMLLANEVVATDIHKRKLIAAFRVHGKPDPEKIKAFAEVAQRLGMTVKAGDVEDPKALAALSDQIAGKPYAQLLHFLLLRAMQQAVYDTKNIGHFGLAAPNYVHFTSPIRRYPDILVHRMVRALARKKKPPYQQAPQELQQRLVQASQRERRAMQVERSAVDLQRAYIMQGHLHEVFGARVSGFSQLCFFCTLEQPFVDVCCRYEDLGEEPFDADELGLKVVGRRSGFSIELGQELRVRVIEVSLPRRATYAVPEDIEYEAPENRRRNSERRRPHERSRRRR